jgi:hypothetical protein
VKRTMLIQSALVGSDGKQANLYITEAKPGVDLGRHYHRSSQVATKEEAP